MNSENKSSKTVKIKNIATIAVFAAITAIIPIASMIMPDLEISKSERRHLAEFPEITAEKIFSSELSGEIEEYLLDHVVMRDGFRTIKSAFQFGVLRQKDNNNIYISDGTVSKMEYPLNEISVKKAARKLNDLREKYLSESAEAGRLFYSVIPDKNYYLAEKGGYLSIDFEKLESILAENLSGFEYIPITDTLSADDYYKTDTHWSQEKIGGVVNRLAERMGFVSEFDINDYEIKLMEPFYGVYYGQSALPLAPDTIYYLTSPVTENAEVYNLETNSNIPVYTTDKFTGMDSYDIFLNGAAAFITITNENSKSDRELILFRDSFGSSLAPLLIDEYRTITLVDIRYISSSLLDQFIDFHGQDVLFMYSVGVWNNSDMLK